MTWFKAESPEDCKTVPDEVSHDNLPGDICEGVSVIIENLSETMIYLFILFLYLWSYFHFTECLYYFRLASRIDNAFV